MRFRWSVLPVLASVALVGACGDDDNGRAGSGGSSAKAARESTGPTAGVEAVDTNTMESATGDVTYCTGVDNSGAQKESVRLFNREFADQGLRARLLEFPEGGDQRNQFIQRQRARSAECDIFYADVTWMAELASQKWLLDMTPYVRPREPQFIPSTLETARYDGKYFGVPKATGAALLYYRTDQIATAPATWQEVYQEAGRRDGIVYQGAAYEGLTCDFLELAFAAGGQVLSEDGTQSQINSAENLRALQLMVDGIEAGAAPRAVITYEEEEARRAFEAGRATFMRNWPYAYALGRESEVGKDFEVAPLPSFEGGGQAGILGGQNLVISVYSENKAGSLKLIDYLTQPPAIKLDATKYSSVPVLMETYDDPDVREALPFAAEARQAVELARPRPVSPVYPLISEAIYENVNAALSGRVSPREALEQADTQIKQALQTF